MRLHGAFKVLFLCSVACASVSRIEADEQGKPKAFLGRWLVSGAGFPVAAETVEIPFPDGDLEGTTPPARPARGEVVAGSDAPQGKRYTRIAAGRGSVLMPPSLAIKRGRPYFLSFWLRFPVMSAAYLDERAQVPPYDLSPRPGDGRNLASSAAKWSGAAGNPASRS